MNEYIIEYYLAIKEIKFWRVRTLINFENTLSERSKSWAGVVAQG